MSTAALSAPPRPGSPALPAGLTIFVARQLAARRARQLDESGDGVAAQEDVLRTLLAGFAATRFGREHGLERRLPYETFRSRVTPRAYEEFAPYIECMKRGERDVLWPGRCDYFAVSSGTTAGSSKYLPVNAAMLAHFREAGLDSLFCYSARVGHSRVFLGRHLFLGGATSLVPLANVEPPIRCGDLSGITAMHLPRWVERYLYEPGAEIAGLTDWSAKIRAIADRTIGRNLTLVAGIPSWLLVLAEAVRQRAAELQERLPASLHDVWPNLECLIHGGVPIAPFTEQLRQAYGRGIHFHEVYPASEGFIAVQDAEPADGLRLLTNRGLFFEFLPLADYNARDPERCAAAAVPLAGVRTGVDYVLLLTTPAGLCRYVIGDVVRFTSTRPPRLVYAGRTSLQLSAFGEHVIEKELTDSLTAVFQRHGLALANFHVAPDFADPMRQRPRGRHEWWIELRPAAGGATPPATLAAELDRELRGRNDDYAGKRDGGGMDDPAVHLVPPGTFEAWQKREGKWGGQSKMPRCRSDRAIADALAGFAVTIQSETMRTGGADFTGF